jgi:cyclohexanone monooxygenase
MQQSDTTGGSGILDAVVVGAGFAGLYMVKRLADQGRAVRCIEAASDVGGTWYWNKYPGAQCDVESLEYSYGFDNALQQDWHWTERFARQPEILNYARHVADRFNLRRHIRFDTRVESAVYDESSRLWQVTLAGVPDIPGLDRFKGRWYHSSRWPNEGVDFTGMRVALIGTGSTGIQITPVVAAQAAHLTVFQRSPNFVVPGINRDLDPQHVRAYKATYPETRLVAKHSQYGVAGMLPPTQSAFDVSPQERQARYEKLWGFGSHTPFLTAFTDLLLDQKANDTAADFVRGKVREIVKDPKVADILTAFDHPLGARRLCAGNNYYETFNRPNVTLVNVKPAPIETFTEKGLVAGGVEHEFDIVIFATGFDAMTGALREIDIRGRGNQSLNDKWKDGPATYLGLMIAGFPNLFIITGPGSPSVKSNVVLSIEQHVDWISDCLAALDQRGIETIEADAQAEAKWVAHVNEVAAPTLYVKTDSWYTGANVPGKPKVFMPYVGGIGRYRKICDEVAADNYRGFVLRPKAPATA